MAATAPFPPRILGRYALYDVIASGGMATVHFGRLMGPVGFARTVAIKRLHPQFARDPEFVSMFLDEARLAARIRHPNVVPTLDVVALEGELFLVMEYVQGEPLGALLRASHQRHETVPVGYAVSIVAGALRGLHAAHEATDERGSPLGIVHRDISPQNILVGVDGVARVLDFGVAKAAGRVQTTRDGQIKGKMAYMPPEQIKSAGTDRRTDVYAAGAVLWESLTGRRLFYGENDVAVFAKVLEGKVARPSEVTRAVPPELDAIVLRALSQAAEDRFPTAKDMARALDSVVPLVPTAEIGEWVESIGAEHLASRTRTVSRIEVDSSASYRPEGQTSFPASSSFTGPSSALSSPSSSFSGPSSALAPSRAPQDAESLDDSDITVERTEVSQTSNVHSAIIARFDRTRILAAGGGFGGVLLLVILYAAFRGSGSSPTVTVSDPTEPAISTRSQPSAAPSVPATIPTAPAASGPSGLDASTVAIPVPAHHAAPVAAPPPTPKAAAPPAPPRQHPPARSLDTVLDSRK